MTPLAQALSSTPELFPALLDPASDMVTLWRLTREDYRHASFLDRRIAADKPSRQITFQELARAVDEAALLESCHFIIHIGHVGSTLLSRLLDRYSPLFSLREPEILRTLATCPAEARERYLSPFLKLWSRTFEAGRAVVKTTSFVSEIAPALLSRAGKPRAVAMGVAPEIYLATIFGGANTPAEARALAPFRLSRLKSRLSVEWRLDDFGEGELVAMAWLCETLCIAEAVAAAPTQVVVLNFEDFLDNAPRVLRTALQHLGALPTDTEIRDILNGPDMGVYSKATEYMYNSDTRRGVLAAGRAKWAAEIREGMQWLDRVAAEHTRVCRALTQFN